MRENIHTVKRQLQKVAETVSETVALTVAKTVTDRKLLTES